MSLRTVPVHQSLVRPLLLAGGDRDLVLMNVVVMTGSLFMMGLSIGSILFLLSFGGIVHLGLVRLAKIDPEMRWVWISYRRYRAFYPATPDVRARPGGPYRSSLSHVF